MSRVHTSLNSPPKFNSTAQTFTEISCQSPECVFPSKSTKYSLNKNVTNFMEIGWVGFLCNPANKQTNADKYLTLLRLPYVCFYGRVNDSICLDLLLSLWNPPGLVFFAWAPCAPCDRCAWRLHYSGVSEQLKQRSLETLRFSLKTPESILVWTSISGEVCKPWCRRADWVFFVTT